MAKAKSKKQLKTIICLILDRSGSMGGRVDDVVKGVNAFIEEQKKLKTPAALAMVRFDSEATECFRPMVNMNDVAELKNHEYKPRGGTPLLDAVGHTIVQLDDDWKAEKADRAIVVIVTDGQENSSVEYTKEKVKALVKAREDIGKWTFIYLGANVDSFAEASTMGIQALNTANYKNTAQGTRAMYSSVSSSVAKIRSTGATTAHNLGGDITEDGSLKKRADVTSWKSPT